LAFPLAAVRTAGRGGGEKTINLLKARTLDGARGLFQLAADRGRRGNKTKLSVGKRRCETRIRGRVRSKKDRRKKEHTETVRKILAKGFGEGSG